MHTRVQKTICSVPRERVEGPSTTASVNGDSDGSWGGISPVAVMSVFANRQSGVRGVLFHRKRKYLALGMIGDRTEYVFVAPLHVEALMEKVVSEVTEPSRKPRWESHRSNMLISSMQYRGKSRPGSYIGDPLGTCCHVDQTWRFQAFLQEYGKVVVRDGDVYHRETRALHRSLQCGVQRFESPPRET